MFVIQTQLNFPWASKWCLLRLLKKVTVVVCLFDLCYHVYSHDILTNTSYIIIKSYMHFARAT